MFTYGFNLLFSFRQLYLGLIWIKTCNSFVINTTESCLEHYYSQFLAGFMSADTAAVELIRLHQYNLTALWLMSSLMIALIRMKRLSLAVADCQTSVFMWRCSDVRCVCSGCVARRLCSVCVFVCCWVCAVERLSCRTPSTLWSRRTSTSTTSWRTWREPCESCGSSCSSTATVRDCFTLLS